MNSSTVSRALTALVTGALALTPAAFALPSPATAQVTGVDPVVAAVRLTAAAAPTTRPKVAARTLDLPAPAKARSGQVAGIREGAPLQVLRTSVTSNTTVGVTWDAGPHDRAVTVTLRSRSGSAWSTWQRLDLTPTPTDAPRPTTRTGTDAITVTNAQEVEVALATSDGSRVVRPTLTVVDPGAVLADSAPRPSASGNVASGGLPDVPMLDTTPAAAETGPMTAAPAVATGATDPALTTPTAVAAPYPNGMPWVNARSAWGADESITEWPGWRMPVTKAIVVHHTAGSNDYTAAQVPGILRGIQYFHAVTRGWGDIGYNILVDKFGRVWQGRTGGPLTPNLGGHAAPNNEETMGISMMGNYEVAQPPAAAVSAVARVAAYRLSQSGYRATDTVWIRDHDGLVHGYPAVTTHQAVAAYGNLPTGCPGRYMIARMSALRTQVANMQAQAGFSFGVQRLYGADTRTRSFELSAGTYLPWEDQKWTDPSGARRIEALVLTSTRETNPAPSIFGANLALSWRSPVMAVDPTSVAYFQLAEVRRLAPKRVFVVGTTGEISDAVVKEITTAAGITDTTRVKRYGSGSAYVTAADIAADTQGYRGTVYLTEGVGTGSTTWYGLPQLAAKEGAPILMTMRGALYWPTLNRLKQLRPTRIRLAGPASAWTDAQVAAIRTAVPGATVERFSKGTTADSTNALVVQTSQAGVRPAHAYYVNRAKPSLIAPALAAAGATGGAVYLTESTCTGADQYALGTTLPATVLHGVSAYTYTSAYASGAPFRRKC